LIYQDKFWGVANKKAFSTCVLTKWNDKIVVVSPSIDDLNWNNDKTSVKREDFHAQVVIKHSVLKVTLWNTKINFVKVDLSILILKIREELPIKRPSVYVLGWNEW